MRNVWIMQSFNFSNLLGDFNTLCLILSSIEAKDFIRFSSKSFCFGQTSIFFLLIYRWFHSTINNFCFSSDFPRTSKVFAMHSTWAHLWFQTSSTNNLFHLIKKRLNLDQDSFRWITFTFTFFIIQQCFAILSIGNNLDEIFTSEK